MERNGQSIDQWLRENTFHHREFDDLKRLLHRKEEEGLAISLCIPTWNEAQTIHQVVTALKKDLMDQLPLLDEIAVIDSGSDDDTREIAAEAGADTYLASDILPQYGSKSGKGENLWKAVHQLKGDIICYVDADIRNIHSRFASATLAPLLFHRELFYVKAFYDRPLAFAEDLSPSGGGRVTEILVRPLFSMFLPELSAMIQPLSGEYAVRREVLERLPFPVGYGVEVAHLVDLHQSNGLGAFAQIDLETRVHRNQSTMNLGPMAFGILQTFIKRMQDQGIVHANIELGTLFRHFPIDNRREEPFVHEIAEEERPPMITLPEYRARHGR